VRGSCGSLETRTIAGASRVEACGMKSIGGVDIEPPRGRHRTELGWTELEPTLFVLQSQVRSAHLHADVFNVKHESHRVRSCHAVLRSWSHNHRRGACRAALARSASPSTGR